MKTISISGKKVKSKTVSLSKAAKYLAKFVKSDNGASEANLGFLKRASAAFNELNAFHKEIRKLKSRGSKGEGGEVVGFIENVMNEVVVEERKKKDKKNQRDVQEDGEFDDLNNNGGEVDGRKRKKLEDGKEGRFEDSEEMKLKKKKRKKNREAEAE